MELGREPGETPLRTGVTPHSKEKLQNSERGMGCWGRPTRSKMLELFRAGWKTENTPRTEKEQ